MRDEALSLCGAARESQPSFLSLERVLDTLDVTQEVPRHTHLHLKGTPCVPPQLKNSPFSPPHLKMRVLSLLLQERNHNYNNVHHFDNILFHIELSILHQLLLYKLALHLNIRHSNNLTTISLLFQMHFCVRQTPWF